MDGAENKNTEQNHIIKYYNDYAAQEREICVPMVHTTAAPFNWFSDFASFL